MSARQIVYLISICGLVAGSFLANMIHMMMVDQVNDKRPEGIHFSHLRFEAPPIKQIVGEYRRLYPHRKLHICALGAFALALISMIILIVNSIPLSRLQLLRIQPAMAASWRGFGDLRKLDLLVEAGFTPLSERVQVSIP